MKKLWRSALLTILAASTLVVAPTPPPAHAATLVDIVGGLAKLKVEDGSGAWHATVTLDADTGWTDPTATPGADRPGSSDSVQSGTTGDWCKLEVDATGSPGFTAPDYFIFRMYVPGSDMTVGGTGYGGWDATPEFGYAEDDYIDAGGIGHVRDERHGGEIRLDWDNNYGAYYGAVGSAELSDDDTNNETPPSGWDRPVAADSGATYARFPCAIAGFPFSPDDNGNGSFGTVEYYLEAVGGGMGGATTRGGNASAGGTTTSYWPGYATRTVEISSTFRVDDERDIADNEATLTFGDPIYVRVDWSDQPLDGHVTAHVDDRGPCDADGDTSACTRTDTTFDTPPVGGEADKIWFVDNPQLKGQMAAKVRILLENSDGDADTYAEGVRAEGYLNVDNDVSTTRGEAFLGFVDQAFPTDNYDIAIEFEDSPTYNNGNSAVGDDTPYYGELDGSFGQDVMVWRSCGNISGSANTNTGSCHASGSGSGFRTVETGGDLADENDHQKRIVKMSALTTSGTNYASNGAMSAWPNIDDTGIQAPVGFRPDGGDNEEYEELQSQIGTNGRMAGAVRFFETTWADEPSTSNNVVAAAKQGKLIVWSTKHGSSWASAASDLTQFRSIVADAQSLATTWNLPKIVLAFHHEPHDQNTDSPWSCSSDCFGDSDDYKAAYATFRDAQIDYDGVTGGNQTADRVVLAYIGVASNMDNGSPIGASDTMRPDTADYDVISTDPYNWFCYKASGACDDSDWEDPAEHLDSSLELAKQYDKPLIIAETATHPGCFGDNPGINECENSQTSTDDMVDWIDRLATWIETDADAQTYLVAITYFHSLHEHDWRFFPIHEGGNPTSALDSGEPAGSSAAVTEWGNEFGSYPQTGVDFALDPTP